MKQSKNYKHKQYGQSIKLTRDHLTDAVRYLTEDGVQPSTLIVPKALEKAAAEVFNKGFTVNWETEAERIKKYDRKHPPDNRTPMEKAIDNAVKELR